MIPAKDAAIAVSQLTEDLRGLLRGAAQKITPDKTKLVLLKTLLMLKWVPENFHKTALGEEISLSPSASY